MPIMDHIFQEGENMDLWLERGWFIQEAATKQLPPPPPVATITTKNMSKVESNELDSNP